MTIEYLTKNKRPKMINAKHCFVTRQARFHVLIAVATAISSSCLGSIAFSQEPPPPTPKVTDRAGPVGGVGLDKEARTAAAMALDIVGNRMKAAKSIRATVELTVRSTVGEESLGGENSVYQLASLAPNLYTVYLKSSEQSFRIFCDGKDTSVLLSPTAYYKTPTAESLQAVVSNLPVPLGPYPEPVMALTLCGVDPKESLMTEMESLEIVDREPYNNTASVHLRGVQVDGVSWDLWLATDKEKAQPLRMIIDLTKVIGAGNGNPLPENFSYELELLFTLWRVDGELATNLFTFNAPKDAVEYESLDDYNQSVTDNAHHVLTGEVAPDFEAVLYQPATDKVADSGVKTTAPTVTLSNLKGKIVVLDFWATWCGPCIKAMPVIFGVANRFADRGVEFYAVNAGEDDAAVQSFFATAEVKPKVLLDPAGELCSAFKANAIPQTVIVGKDGRIEIVHVGYLTLESLEKELGEQLEVLASGGTLLPVSE